MASFLPYISFAKLTCEDGWLFHDDYCYRKLDHFLMNYDKATQLCNYAFGSTVLTIDSPAEESFVNGNFSTLATNIWVVAKNSKYHNWMNEAEYSKFFTSNFFSIKKEVLKVMITFISAEKYLSKENKKSHPDNISNVILDDIDPESTEESVI